MPEYMNALIFSLLFGLLGWLYSVAKANVNIVDSMWSLFFVINALCFAHFDPLGPNQTIVFSLLVICVSEMHTSLKTAVTKIFAVNTHPTLP